MGARPDERPDAGRPDERRAALVRRLMVLYPNAPRDVVDALLSECEAVVVGLDVGDVEVRTEQLVRARLEARYG